MGFYMLSGGATVGTPLRYKRLVLKVNGIVQVCGCEDLDTCCRPLTNVKFGDSIAAELEAPASNGHEEPEVWLHYSDGTRSLAAKKIAPKAGQSQSDESCIIDFPLAQDERKRASQRELVGVVPGGNVNSFGQSVVVIQSSGLSLSYNSCRCSEALSGLGWGWSLDGFHIWLETDLATGDLVFHDGYGSFDRWTLQDGAYRSCYSNNHICASRENDGTYLLITNDGTQLSFGQDGKLVSEVDRNGFTVFYEYEPPKSVAGKSFSGRLVRSTIMRDEALISSMATVMTVSRWRCGNSRPLLVCKHCSNITPAADFPD